MKKTIIILFILVSINMVSQEKFKIGLEIGPNISFFSGEEPNFENETPISTLAFGITGEYLFSKNWSFKSGVLFETKGNTSDLIYYNGPFGTRIVEDVDSKINYTTVQYFIKYTTNGKFQFFTNFGPSISLFIRKGSEAPFAVNSFDLAANVGFGIQRKFNKNNFSIEARYSKGLLDANEQFRSSRFFGTVYNNSVMLIIGYSYSL